MFQKRPNANRPAKPPRRPARAQTPKRSPAAKNSDYEAHKRRARERQAGLVRAGQDIGPIPPCKNPARRAACAKNLQLYAETYFAERFPLAWSQDHLDVWRELQRVVGAGGLQAIALQRGGGKTTQLDTAISWAINYGYHSYAVLATATAKLSPRRISVQKVAYLVNDLLAEDFPEICFPIRAMGNRANKCAGMLSEGRNLWPASNESQWSTKRIILPTVPGSPASGAIMEASGLLEALRGLNYPRADGTIARPTLILLDDPQTDRSARSPLQCQTRAEALSKGILYLGPPDRKISALAAVTVIEPGDMADQILDRAKNGSWHGIRCPALRSFPSDLQLWDQYADIFRGELSAGSADFAQSRKFYRAHRKALDAGADPAWPARKEDCLSATEFLMRRFIQDRRAFMSEFQQEPERDEDTTAAADQLTADQLCARVGTSDRGEVPPAVQRITWFVDVHKEILYWVVCGWEPGFTGHVLDYGTWPKQDGTYFDHRHLRHKITKSAAITATTREGQTQQALSAFFAEFAARDWRRADGLELRPDLGLVDANDGEVTDAIYAACRAAQKTAGLRVMPSHGQSFGPAKCPISRWDRTNLKEAVVGDEWLLPAPKKCRIIRHVVFDANRRKAFLWRRLCTPIGDPGAMVFFHAEPQRHRLLAEHIASEKGTRVTGPHGELIVYQLSPGQPNHWLDCLSGCATAESICGGKLRSALPQATAKPAPPRSAVTYYDPL